MRIAAVLTRREDAAGAADRRRLEQVAGRAGALTGSVTALTLRVPSRALAPVGHWYFSSYGSRH
jgi:hypothetical protein